MVTATTARTALPRCGALPCARWLDPRAGGLQGLRRAVGEVPGGWTGDDGAASLSRLSVWSYVVGEGCAACFLSALDVFLSASLSLCSPVLRQLTLPDGSGGDWVERAPCLEAEKGWLWRPDESVPLSR